MNALKQFRATITACTTDELKALAVKSIIDGRSEAKTIFAGVLRELKKRVTGDEFAAFMQEIKST